MDNSSVNVLNYTYNVNMLAKDSTRKERMPLFEISVKDTLISNTTLEYSNNYIIPSYPPGSILFYPILSTEYKVTFSINPTENINRLSESILKLSNIVSSTNKTILFANASFLIINSAKRYNYIMDTSQFITNSGYGLSEYLTKMNEKIYIVNEEITKLTSKPMYKLGQLYHDVSMYYTNMSSVLDSSGRFKIDSFVSTNINETNIKKHFSEKLLHKELYWVPMIHCKTKIKYNKLASRRSKHSYLRKDKFNRTLKKNYVMLFNSYGTRTNVAPLKRILTDNSNYLKVDLNSPMDVTIDVLQLLFGPNSSTCKINDKSKLKKSLVRTLKDDTLIRIGNVSVNNGNTNIMSKKYANILKHIKRQKDRTYGANYITFYKLYFDLTIGITDVYGRMYETDASLYHVKLNVLNASYFNF